MIEDESTSDDVQDQVRVKESTWKKAKEHSIHLSQVDSNPLLTPGSKYKLEGECNMKSVNT